MCKWGWITLAKAKPISMFFPESRNVDVNYLPQWQCKSDQNHFVLDLVQVYHNHTKVHLASHRKFWTKKYSDTMKQNKVQLFSTHV